MLHLLAEKYGWTIEYIMNLTRPQVRALIDGMAELNRLQSKNINDEKMNSRGKGERNYNINSQKPESIMQIFSMPGVKLSEKAQQALNKMKE